MSEIAPIIVALTGLCTALGAVGRFLWNKIEKRFDQLERDMEKCDRDRGVQLIVIELLWHELDRLTPGAPIFARVKKLFDDLKEGKA